MLIPAIVTLVAGWIFWKLTETPEVSAGRGVKISVSLPIVWFIAATVSKPIDLGSSLTAITLALALVFLWRGNVAHLIGHRVARFFYGDGSQSAGHTPEYKFAREKALAGEFEEAIKLCHWELSKQPDNYEGLLLLATIYMERKQPKLALEQIELILKTPHLSDPQQREAMQAKSECLNAIR